MRIGLDLDGTIIVYDDVFHLHAVRCFGMPVDVPARKGDVRDWLRGSAAGEAGWIELQRLVYGPRILDASPAPGVGNFLRECRELGFAVSIVSHKTRLSAAEPRFDLHAAALKWLQSNGFFAADGHGLDRDAVYFEPTRASKLRRIASEGCLLFVDDLEEVLADPAFPPGIERWLYAPAAPEAHAAGVNVFSDWSAVSRRLPLLREAYVGD
jgi:hypothetical protein